MQSPNHLRGKKDAHTDVTGKSESQPTYDKDIKCFKCLGKGNVASRCPKRRVMLTITLVDCSDKGEALVIRQTLNMQIKEDDVDQQ